MPTSETGRDPVPGTVIKVIEIPARHAVALEVRRGQLVRLIDVEGQQVGDLVCFNRDDLAERYSPQNTILFNWAIYPKVGATLVSDHGCLMMRLVADTVGVHDLICGSCSDEYYKNRLDHHEPHRSCRSNLAEALAPWGVPLKDIPFSFNVFMRWPVQPDGSVVPMAAPSKPGDYVDLRAELDLVVANSACPSDITPTNAYNPTPMRLLLYQPVGALMPRLAETFVASLAVWKLGAVYVPLFTAFGADAIRRRLAASEARAVVTEARYRELLESGLDEDVPVIVVGRQGRSG